MNKYQTLPAPPENLTASNVLRRFIDSIGHRFYLATQGMTPNEHHFRPVEGSMDMTELLNHIYRISFWAYRAFNPAAKFNREASTFEELKEEILLVCEVFSDYLAGLSEEELVIASIYLKRTNTNYSFWYIINGPLTDVLTHIGQINSWRRIAGNPCPKISPLTGDSS